jgi:nitrate/nitrite transporter NarK
MVDRRAKPLLPFVVLGCVAAILAATGGAGTIVGAILALLLIVAFSLLYLAGHIGPQLPPFRVSKRVLSVAVWLMVASIVVLALLLVKVYSSPASV